MGRYGGCSVRITITHSSLSLLKPRKKLCLKLFFFVCIELKSIGREEKGRPKSRILGNQRRVKAGRDATLFILQRLIALFSRSTDTVPSAFEDFTHLGNFSVPSSSARGALDFIGPAGLITLLLFGWLIGFAALLWDSGTVSRVQFLGLYMYSSACTYAISDRVRHLN